MLLASLTAVAVVLIASCGGGGGSGADGDVSPASPSTDFSVETVAEGFEHPWGIAFLPDGRMLVTERSGGLNIVDAATGQRTPVAGVPDVASGGQGGLLDVALHPDFLQNDWVYLSYTAGGEGLSTHVGRGILRDGALVDFQLLFRATPGGTGTEHFGGRLGFDRDDYLYLTLGDRHDRQRAQDLADHNGSVIRLQDDGSVPVDNPLVGREGVEMAIYTYGHRNVQGIAVDPQTGQVWISEHGPQGGDEINALLPGGNYGWPVISYGEEYGGGAIGPTHQQGMEQPVYHWTPAIAPSGMAIYTGDAFSAWKGNLFVAGLAGQSLVRLTLNGTQVTGEQRLLSDREQRLRDVEQGPDGFLYLLVDADDAPILRLRPAQ